MLFIAVHCINAGRSKANHRKELKTWKEGERERVSDNESGRRGEGRRSRVTSRRRVERLPKSRSPSLSLSLPFHVAFKWKQSLLQFNNKARFSCCGVSLFPPFFLLLWKFFKILSTTTKVDLGNEMSFKVFFSYVFTSCIYVQLRKTGWLKINYAVSSNSFLPVGFQDEIWLKQKNRKWLTKKVLFFRHDSTTTSPKSFLF